MSINIIVIICITIIIITVRLIITFISIVFLVVLLLKPPPSFSSSPFPLLPPPPPPLNYLLESRVASRTQSFFPSVLALFSFFPLKWLVYRNFSLQPKRKQKKSDLCPPVACDPRQEDNKKTKEYSEAQR